MVIPKLRSPYFFHAFFMMAAMMVNDDIDRGLSSRAPTADAMYYWEVWSCGVFLMKGPGPGSLALAAYVSVISRTHIC